MMTALTGGLLLANSSVKELQKGFANLKPVIASAVGALAGFEMLKGVKSIAEHGEKLLDQQDKLRRAGIAQTDVLRMQAEFYDKIAGTVPTANAAEYLKTVNELRAVTGSVAGAQTLAPKAMMVDTLLSNTFGKKMEGEYYKLLRSAEMKGIATSPEKLAEFTDRAFSYITAFGGKLTAQDYQTFARRGGSAFINADVGKAMGPLSVLMADLGGSGAGTAAMTLQQLQLGAMTLSKQQASVMQEAGLLDMSKVTKTGFGGGRMQLAPGAVVGSAEFTGDLPGWIQQVVMPHLRKMAGNDDKILQSLISKMFPNRNALKLALMFGEPGFEDQIRKDLGLAAQVKPIPEAYQSFISTNPVGVKKAFGEQEESMLQAIGAPLMQAAIPVMKAITAAFTAIGAWANAHPDLIKALGIAFTALGAALVVAGTALVGGALIGAIGVGGWLVAGIVALGTAAGVAAAAFKMDFKGLSAAWSANWNAAITSALTSAGESIKTAAFAVFTGLKDAVVGNFNNMKESLAPFFALFPSWEKIIAGLKSAFSGLFDWLKEKINWLGSFVPGWKDISGRAMDIPGMSEHLHGGGGGSSGYSLAGGGTYADQIRKYGGSDAPALMAIARSEGGIGNRYDTSGDHGRARGPFQFNHGLLGDQLIREGINIDNPATFPAQVAWMRRYGRIHGGWGANVWHGIHDKYHVPSLRSHPDDIAGGHSQRQSAVPPPRGQQQQAHTEVHLDGRIISHLVERRIVQKHRFAHGTADHDGRAGYPHVDSASNMG